VGGEKEGVIIFAFSAMGMAVIFSGYGMDSEILFCPNQTD
jgi:hypothetical protein